MGLKKRFSQSLAVTGIACLAALPLQSQAGLIFDTITVSNAIGQYLQVSEVVAFGTGTQADVALVGTGAGATANNYWQSNDGSCGAGVANEGVSVAGGTAGAVCSIDGSGPASYASGGLYHGANTTNGLLTITLAAATEIDYVQIFGRSDSCCSLRDVYNVDLLLGGEIVKTISSLEAESKAALPLPGTIALLGMGLLGLGVRLRKTA